MTPREFRSKYLPSSPVKKKMPSFTPNLEKSGSKTNLNKETNSIDEKKIMIQMKKQLMSIEKKLNYFLGDKESTKSKDISEQFTLRTLEKEETDCLSKNMHSKTTRSKNNNPRKSESKRLSKSSNRNSTHSEKIDWLKALNGVMIEKGR